MCQILKEPPPQQEGMELQDRTDLTNTILSGLPTSVPKGVIMSNGDEMTATVHCICKHQDGRSDEYFVKPGEHLEVDDDAELVILNPEEVQASAKAAHERRNIPFHAIRPDSTGTL